MTAFAPRGPSPRASFENDRWKVNLAKKNHNEMMVATPLESAPVRLLDPRVIPTAGASKKKPLSGPWCDNYIPLDVTNSACGLAVPNGVSDCEHGS